MKNATEFAKKFKKFKKSLPDASVKMTEHGVIGEVVYAHLLWNATSKQASQAYKRLMAATVDMNDLRVHHLYETIDLIGESYPQVYDRTKRLKTVLDAIYKREHGMHVASLEGAGKRDIRDYFESLKGISPFVCNRIIAICFEVAAMPVDDRTLAVMISNDLIHESADVADASSWLTRQVKAGEIGEIHVRLHTWVELQPIPKPPKKVTRKIRKKTFVKVVAKAVVESDETLIVEEVAPKKPVKKKTVTKKKVAKTKTPKKKVTKKKTSKKQKTTTKKVVKKTPPTKKKATKKKVANKPSSKKKVAKKKVAKKKAAKKK
ncbi:MAG: hypothetical protein ACKVLC_00350 [Phycisphaerales bacterium]